MPKYKVTFVVGENTNSVLVFEAEKVLHTNGFIEFTSMGGRPYQTLVASFLAQRVVSVVAMEPIAVPVPVPVPPEGTLVPKVPYPRYRYVGYHLIHDLKALQHHVVRGGVVDKSLHQIITNLSYIPRLGDSE